MSSTIDTDAFSIRMRERGIRRGERLLRITNFHGSEQERDFTLPANCDGFGRVRHFRRATSPSWPENPLPIDPAARALGLGRVDEIKAQVFQNAVCNWRCWYCFVDFELLSGRDDRSAWLSPEQLVDMYAAADDRPPMIDLSGGQPDLVPEWIPWMMQALRAAGLEREIYLWSDDNLSNDYLWRHLAFDERELLSNYKNYGKVCCLKGFDRESFSFNTLAEPELFQRQVELLKRLVAETTIDLYGYATFTAPDDVGVAKAMAALVDQLQEIDKYLPLRVIPLEVRGFTPATARMKAQHERALAVQYDAISAWNDELRARFSSDERALPICNVPLRG
jgi:uncharacterized Fe-S cluster-containing radical SAM superfamily protein